MLNEEAFNLESALTRSRIGTFPSHQVLKLFRLPPPGSISFSSKEVASATSEVDLLD